MRMKTTTPMMSQPWGNLAGFGLRRRADGRLDFVAAGDFALEPLHALQGVEAEIIGIAAHESDRIGTARKRLETVFFQGLQMVAADFQCAGYGGEIVATPKTGGTQVLPDRLERSIRVAGNLAEMNPLPAQCTAFVERQMSHFGHRGNE